jgi:radical SAM protein with 4Fe4S-binding SPASM domain
MGRCAMTADEQKLKEEKAVTLFHAGQFQQSEAIFSELLQSYQGFWLWRSHAIVSLRLKNLDRALASINRALALEPANASGYLTKIDILRAAGMRDALIQCCNELLLVDPSQKNAALIKGQAYEVAGNVVLSDLEYKNYLERMFGLDKGIRELNHHDLMYHIRHQYMKATPFMNYPKHVMIETFAQCNAACSFCVYPDMARKGQQMPMKLIDKIIDDLQKIPREIKFQLSPFAVNEPFLDKRIFEVLDKIALKLPNAQITLTSNASPLTPAILKKLSAYDLDYLWLSIVDYRKEVYEEKMKLSYDRLLKRLEMIHKAKEKGWFPYRTVLSRLIDRSEHDQKYHDFFKSRFPLFEIALWPYANWLGKTDNAITSNIPNLPCEHWFEFRIDAKGIVQHCCMDGHSDYPWGDVNKQSVLEIYNNPAYKKLRQETFSRLETSPCNTCNLR